MVDRRDILAHRKVLPVAIILNPGPVEHTLAWIHATDLNGLPEMDKSLLNLKDDRV